MRAAILRNGNITVTDVPIPERGKGELLVKVLACGLCRTDLHILDGELKGKADILGHQIVGEVVEGTTFRKGTLVGIPWLGGTDGTCEYCSNDQENLCATAEFTGYTRDGGLAEYATAREAFCIPLPDGDPAEQAPLLCAGLIGYRALRKCNSPRRLGLYGFGSSAHILAQITNADVYAFTRPGDATKQAFAKQLGAVWAGGSNERPGEQLDAAIIFAPTGELVPAALATVRPGGIVVCAGIHMSDIPAFPYRLLWKERTLTSVANLTREDAKAFFARTGSITTRVTTFPLNDVRIAFEALRSGVEGSVVIRN